MALEGHNEAHGAAVGSASLLLPGDPTLTRAPSTAPDRPTGIETDVIGTIAKGGEVVGTT